VGGRSSVPRAAHVVHGVGSKVVCSLEADCSGRNTWGRHTFIAHEGVCPVELMPAELASLYTQAGTSITQMHFSAGAACSGRNIPDCCTFLLAWVLCQDRHTNTYMPHIKASRRIKNTRACALFNACQLNMHPCIQRETFVDTTTAARVCWGACSSITKVTWRVIRSSYIHGESFVPRI